MTGEVYFGMTERIKQSIITVRLLTWLKETAVVIITTPTFRGHIHYSTACVWAQPRVNTCYSPAGPEEGRSVTPAFCCRRGLNLPLVPDTTNRSPFNFDKYSPFNLGPGLIQNHQEATLAIFMNPNISLILKSCCSFVWQHNWNDIIISNWTGTSKQGKFSFCSSGTH